MTQADRPEFQYVDYDKLRFDPTNPRFGGISTSRTQPEMQELLEREPHLALNLVDSFLENGFIDYEPLVVRREGAEFVVVEGNRRLAAVRHIMANPQDFASRGSRLRKQVPVLIFPGSAAKQEAAQRVYLGVRHLFGFREWPAESKAKFLDDNIKNPADLERTLRELNLPKSEIRRYLVPYRLRRKAARLWEPYKNQDFWVLGEGLSRTGIREYVGLDVNPQSFDIIAYDRDNLKHLLEFIYGKPVSDGKLVNRRIKDTRELSRLARVLQTKRAAGALGRGQSLEQAELYIQTLPESVTRLKAIVTELRVLVPKLTGARAVPRATASALTGAFGEFRDAAGAFIRDAK